MLNVSVIIPVYNRSTQLRAAIVSVINQTFKDFELIIIDDGSTVDIKSFIPEDHRIKRLRQKNSGVSAARNAGIKLAQGKYICFLDSDDTWLPKKLEKQFQYMTENKDCLISQTEDIWIRNGKRVNSHKKHQKKSGNIFFDSLAICLISPSAVMIKKELLGKVGLFDETLPACEDYDLWLRITKDYPVGLIAEPLIVRYAGHADQLSQKYPIMDRFRIKSLQKLLKNKDLKPEQALAVRNMLQQKARIIAQGAFKRRRWFTWLYYRYML